MFKIKYIKDKFEESNKNNFMFQDKIIKRKALYKFKKKM